MDYGQMNRDLREVKTVPWQLTAVILALFFGLPGSVLGTWGMLSAKGQGSGVLAAIVALPSYLMLLWGAFGMRSRLRKAAHADEPVKPIKNKMLGGSAILIGGIVLLVGLSYIAGIPSYVVGGAGFFIVLPGLWLILRAMLPASGAPAHSRRNPSFAAAGVSAPLKTEIPPRSRRG